MLVIAIAWLRHEMLLRLASGVDELGAFAKLMNGRWRFIMRL